MFKPLFFYFPVCKCWFLRNNSYLEEKLPSISFPRQKNSWKVSAEWCSVLIGRALPTAPPTPFSHCRRISCALFLSLHRLEVRWFCVTSVGGWLMSVSQQLLLCLFTHNAYFFPRLFICRFAELRSTRRLSSYVHTIMLPNTQLYVLLNFWSHSN